MMAVLFSSGALLLVLLTGASYSYPFKKGFDSSSSYSSNYGANPEVASETPARPQTVPGGGPSVQRGPPAAASFSSNSFAGPVSSGSASSYPAGSTQPSSFQPPLNQDIAWAVAPPSPFSGAETSGRPGASQSASRELAPAPLGPSNVSPPGHFTPEFQAGELSHIESSYEHGNYESETEDQGSQPPPPGVEVSASQGFTSEPQPSGLGRGLVWYPYDYMFLTGQYPPGTVSHFSSSFEQGTDNWQDSHHIRDYYVSSPSSQQVETFPADPKAPQGIKQPSQPTGLQGRLAQPHLSSLGGGYGARKVGY